MRGKHPFPMGEKYPHSAVQGLLPLAGILFTSAITFHGPSVHTISAATDWIRQHWLTTASITAAAGLIGAVTGFATARTDRKRSRRDRMEAERKLADEQRAHERARALRLIRQIWVTERLERSLTGAEPMPLWCRRQPELVDEPAPVARHLDFRPVRVQARESIREIFDEAGGSLLITGEPGAGKTTLLLQLAKDLLDRAERDTEQPVPVVIDLSDWAWHHFSLMDLVIGKLKANYEVSEETALYWIGQHSVVLLLDELDSLSEFRRGDCVTVINGYLKESGLAQVAVSCRSAEARELRGRPERTWWGEQREARLRVKEAIELEPPTDGQVSAYLTNITESAGWLVADIRAAITADPDFKDFLRSPQRLSALRKGYSELAGHGQALKASRQWPRRLAAAYIEGTCEQYPLTPKRYNRYDWGQATEWLAWLANALSERRSTQFALTDLTEQWLPASHRFSPAFTDTLLRLVAAIGLLRPYAICILLARAKAAPIRYTAFLDEMTRSQMLRRAGKHYSFPHRLLLHYLADQATSASRNRDSTSAIR
jgi:hypothetical protein